MRRFSNSTETRLNPILLATFVAVFAMLAAGCSTTPEPVEEPMDSEFRDETPPPPPPVRETNVSNETLSIAPVYFDLDRSTIKKEYEAILRTAASKLRETGRRVTIEGHCDERGSDEYNVALGERRANSVRRYLLDLGVSASQLTTVSYGEARPAVNGTGETVWQLNRRAQFTIR